MPYSEDHKTAIFLDHRVQVHYVYLPGNAPLPIAYQTGPNPTAPVPFEIVKTAKSGWFKVVSFVLSRVDLKPPIPDRTAATGETLVHAVVTLSDPAEAPNETPVYTCQGCYVYALDNDPDTLGWVWPTGYLLQQPVQQDLGLVGPRVG